jgi:predicted Rossmann fold nucleotide-binding protein DprA/Smf involved in DNA uptake
MNKIQAQLKTISKSLLSLSKQVQRITKQVDKYQPAKKAAPGRPQKAARKAARRRKAIPSSSATLLNAVYSVIKRSPKGATIAVLKTKTGFGARQLSNALYKLSKKGMVRAKSRGLYVKK